VGALSTPLKTWSLDLPLAEVLDIKEDMNLFMQQFKQPLLALVILRIPTHWHGTATVAVVWCGVVLCVQEMIVEVFNEV